MAEQVKLEARPRDAAGRAAARRLRREGRVPGVVYGPKVAPTKVDVDALELYHVLHTSAGANVLVRLQVDGDEHLTMPREVQRHPVRGDLFHVDFVAIDPERLVRVEIPVHLEGAEEIASPGVLTHVLHTVPVRVSPLEIPDHFEIDVSEMVIGDVVRVEDIALPAGAEWDIETERTVATVTAPTIVEVEEEEPEELPEDLATLMEAGELGGDELDASPDELAEDAKSGDEGGADTGA